VKPGDIIVFVDDGLLSCLEYVSYDDPSPAEWPRSIASRWYGPTEPSTPRPRGRGSGSGDYWILTCRLSTGIETDWFRGELPRRINRDENRRLRLVPRPSVRSTPRLGG
jgi:hypothetical protein